MDCYTKEERQKYNKVYRESHKGRTKKKENREEFGTRLQKSTKKNAKEKGLEHDLTPAYIRSIMPEYCPLLGCKLTNFEGEYLWSDPSVDKIDPKGGYTIGNVQILSRLANQMKSCATPEQLVTFARNVLVKYNNGQV